MEKIKNFIVPDPDVLKLEITEDSYPFNMASKQRNPIDISKYGYIEEEYLISGKANVYAWKGSNDAPFIRSSNCPYCTRILVRKPADPKQFSGHVMVECMHAGQKIDNPHVGWGSCYEQILKSGDGWVGVSVAGATFKALKNFNPERYEKLSYPNPLPPEERGPVGNMASSPDQIVKNRGKVLPDDPTTEKGLDMDMFSQVSAAIKRGKPGTPFYGYNAKYTYIIGVTFAEIPCYSAAVLPFSYLDEEHLIYDAAVVYMSGRAGNLNREEGSLSWDDPRTKCGGKVPIIRLMDAGDLRGTDPHPLWAGMVRSKNTDEPGNIGRTYEIAGTSLKYCTSGKWSTYPNWDEIEKAGMTEECSGPNDIAGFDGSKWPVNSMMAPIINGLFKNLKDWAAKGISLPMAEYIDSKAEYPDFVFYLDEHGNQKGGVRNHYVDVPIATYVDNGDIIPFSTEKKNELYGSKDNWLKLTRQCLDKMIADRWILSEDAEYLYEEAKRVPW